MVLMVKMMESMLDMVLVIHYQVVSLMMIIMFLESIGQKEKLNGM